MHFPEAAVASEHRPHLVHHGDLKEPGQQKKVQLRRTVSYFTCYNLQNKSQVSILVEITIIIKPLFVYLHINS